jgi:ATP-dependent RNA helicase DDX54/DBP10
MVVYDECDRLFEMGFAEQLKAITEKMPNNRQSLLFSATISAEVKDFTLAGIKDYRMVTVDKDNKISDLLKIHFFVVRSNEKEAALIYTLREQVQQGEQTIIFGATRYHVEYLCELAIKAGFKANFIYGAMDQFTREEKLRDFRRKRVNFMFVTDLAARGIDIPFLENVIHYDFPTKMKLFIHRAGRTARAGRKGTSYGIITNEELAYLHDLSIFVGRDHMDRVTPEQLSDPKIICFGKIP